jgi:hypothetical protein
MEDHMKSGLRIVAGIATLAIFGLIVVGLVLSSGALSTNPISQATFNSPLPTPELTGSPVPTAAPSTAVPPTLTPPTVEPPATLIYPTPPTPDPNAHPLPKEQVIETLISTRPALAKLQASGQLTVTSAVLTTRADAAAGAASGFKMVHPDTPVWIITLQTPPWTNTQGPVGGGKEITWWGFRFEINALTGKWITASQIPLSERPIPTTSVAPSPVPTPTVGEE